MHGLCNICTLQNYPGKLIYKYRDLLLLSIRHQSGLCQRAGNSDMRVVTQVFVFTVTGSSLHISSITHNRIRKQSGNRFPESKSCIKHGLNWKISSPLHFSVTSPWQCLGVLASHLRQSSRENLAG